MARAGFTAIHSGRIRFGKDGRWYCDGEQISNAAICRLYARTMTVGADGRARLELGEDRAEVEIEDTPWVVTGVDGDAARGFEGVLNDETRGALGLSAERVPYSRVKGGRIEARMLRPAWYELVRHADSAGDGTCVLRAGPQRVHLSAGPR